MFGKIIFLCLIQYGLSQSCDVNDGPSSILGSFLGDSVCDHCVKIVNGAKEELTSEETKKMVKDIVNTICEDLPLQEQCKNALNALYESVSANIEKIDAKGLCQAVHLCKEKDTCTSSKQHSNADKNGSTVQEPTSCEVCKDSIKVVLDTLRNQQVQQMINNVMKEACAAIPNEALKERCEQLFNGPFLRWLESFVPRVDGEKICELLRFCDEITLEKKDLKDDQTCKLCTDVLDQFKSLVQNANFVNRMKQTVDRLCSLCMGHADQCKTTIKNYMDGAIEEVKKMNSRNICQNVRLC